MKNPFDLAGEVALVTGGGSGLGRRFCTVLAVNGARVVVSDRRLDAATEVADHLVSGGHQAIATGIDVTDVHSIAAGFDAAEAAFGTVTISVGAAGAAAEKSALRITPNDWRAMMAVNLDGAWFTAQTAARRMVRAKTGGSIINIASIMGLKVHPRVAHYAVSKAGVVQMTKALALELARSNVRVNAIAPGSFDTGMTSGLLKSTYGKAMIGRVPMRRAGGLGELDGAMLLLASKASSYMNGTVITIDGGHSLVIP
ncbi:3-oxoacyl-[acyl-carrier protein] reductase [hydrothermal vent metagenome]|uniref:3-oxoacyl-[acyl-carrier protein] reductase n=1 Tax=hydrothermal vent metagenome TaxID=652676 RepID=A0A3B0TG33_9ZZZZ